MKSTVPIAREPLHPAGTSVAGAPSPFEIIEVVLLVRGTSTGEVRAESLERLSRQLPRERQYLDRAEYEKIHGARPEDLAVLRSVTAEAGLVTRRVSRAARYVRLSGTVQNFETTFGVKFFTMQGPLGEYRSHRNPVYLPGRLEGIVEAVVGFDTKRHPRPMSPGAASATTGSSGPRPQDVADAYDFPERLAGRGRRIGIIELGGGFHRSDLETYFSSFGLRIPEIEIISTHKKLGNNPSPKALLAAFATGAASGKLPEIPDAEQARFSATVETTLDLQVAGSLANGADLVACFATQTSAGVFLGLAEFLDPARPLVDVISLSWSGPESMYEPGDRWAIDTAVEAAALCGIAVCCSSGDSGGGETNGSAPEVNYPPANPWVLACGGTHLALHGSIVSEAVWNEKVFGERKSSGGGVSALYPMPAWQKASGIQSKLPNPGRGVPDVSAKADVQHGFPICMGGVEAYIGGGTSAASPLWAALAARLSEGLDHRLGSFVPLLYRPPFTSGFRDVVKGTNGTYRASPGWDPCTGWGSPIGTRLLTLLSAQ